MTRICPVCENKVRRRGARFCGKCGSKLQRSYRGSVAFLVVPLVGALVAFFWLHFSPWVPDGGASSTPTSEAAATAGIPPSAGASVSAGVAPTIGAVAATPSVGSTTPPRRSDFSRASTYNLTIADSELIDPTGANPQFSPSGKEMLFDRQGDSVDDRAIWLANSKGQEPYELIPNGTRGSWSPDGKRIAFLEHGPSFFSLSIFSISVGKSVQLMTLSAGSLLSEIVIYGLNWTKDGTKLFSISAQSGPAHLTTVDLDTLKTQDERVQDAAQWLRDNATARSDQNVSFSASTDGIWLSAADGDRRRRYESGDWRIGGSYQRRLLEGAYNSIVAAPNVSTIAYSKQHGGLFMAELVVQEHTSPRRFNVMLKRPDFEYVLKKSDEGRVVCEIFSPHVNPLNGKTVGYQGDVKAVAKFIRLADGSYAVDVVKEYAAVFSGDVVSDMWVEPFGPPVSGWPEKRALENVVILQPEDTGSASAETAARAEAERLASGRVAVEKERQEAQKRLTAKPLELVKIEFMNTTKSGMPLGGPTDDFDRSKVLFVQWQVTFENRLYKLDRGQYRVNAVYFAPDGHTFPGVDDSKTVLPEEKTVTFSGRIGNSAGGLS